MPLCKILTKIFSPFDGAISIVAVSPEIPGDRQAGDACKDCLQLGLEDLGVHAFEVDQCFRLVCTAIFCLEASCYKVGCM